MWDEFKRNVNEYIFELLVSAIEMMLGTTGEIFKKSIANVQTGIVETPEHFSATLVETLRVISETAVMPVAGLLLTYVFCYELYILITEKNKGNDFNTGELLFLIIKTAAAILLITHSFDITLAFFDLSQWMVNQIPNTALTIPEAFGMNITEGLEEGEVGKALMLMAVVLVGMIFALIMAGIIYLVAWGRMITILLYVSVAPLPFATFMNRDWVGTIGQTYVKNLLALMLQGFFIMVCLVIYGGLLEKVSVLMVQEGATVYGMLLMVVSMGVLTVMLTKTHSLAKSVMGVA